MWNHTIQYRGKVNAEYRAEKDIKNIAGCYFFNTSIFSVLTFDIFSILQ